MRRWRVSASRGRTSPGRRRSASRRSALARSEIWSDPDLEGCAGDRRYVGEHAARVPGWEGSYQWRGAVQSDAVPADGLRPGELAGVPFDEGFGVRSDVEVLVEAGVRLADLGLTALD